jgi:hypothetical protein
MSCHTISRADTMRPVHVEMPGRVFMDGTISVGHPRLRRAG